MTNLRFGQGSGPIYFDELACRGNKTSILYCPGNPIGQHDCTHREDIGVICETKMCNDDRLFVVIPFKKNILYLRIWWSA